MTDKEYSAGKFDTRAILALVSICGAFVYQGALLLVAGLNAGSEQLENLPQIPSWMSAITMGVVGFYFGARAQDQKNGGA